MPFVGRRLHRDLAVNFSDLESFRVCDLSQGHMLGKKNKEKDWEVWMENLWTS